MVGKSLLQCELPQATWHAHWALVSCVGRADVSTLIRLSSVRAVHVQCGTCGMDAARRPTLTSTSVHRVSRPACCVCVDAASRRGGVAMSSIATSPRAGRVLTMRAGGRPTGSGRHAPTHATTRVPHASSQSRWWWNAPIRGRRESPIPHVDYVRGRDPPSDRV